MGIRVKSVACSILLLVDSILLVTFLFLGMRIGFFTAAIALIVLTFLRVKAGPSFVTKDEESLLYKYMVFVKEHDLLSIFLKAQVGFIVITVIALYSGEADWGVIILVLIFAEGCVAFGLYIRKHLKD
jgi:hypothetical protein